MIVLLHDIQTRVEHHDRLEYFVIVQLYDIETRVEQNDFLEYFEIFQLRDIQIRSRGFLGIDGNCISSLLSRMRNTWGRISEIMKYSNAGFRFNASDVA